MTFYEKGTRLGCQRRWVSAGVAHGYATFSAIPVAP